MDLCVVLGEEHLPLIVTRGVVGGYMYKCPICGDEVFISNKITYGDNFYCDHCGCEDIIYLRNEVIK